MRHFTHSDGRGWTIARTGATLTITIALPDDPDPIVRVRALRDEHEAQAEENKLVAEQRADGFTELTLPPWRLTLQRWLEAWRDAGFPVEQLAAADSADAEHAMEKVLAMTDRWRTDHRGTVLDLDDAIHELPKRAAIVRADPQCMPLVLLALRDDDNTRVMHAASIARTDAPLSAKEMLWSLIETPPPHAVDATMFERFFDSENENDAARLAGLMLSTNWRVAFTAGWVAAHFGAKRDELFEILWARRHVKSPDFWPFAALRAAELRGDRSLLVELQTWRKSARGEVAQRIDDVVRALS